MVLSDLLIWYATSNGESSDDEEVDESNTARESTDIAYYKVVIACI